MILEPGLRKLRKMRETRRRPGSTSPSVFALLCLIISCAQLSAAHEDQGLGVSRKIDDQVDGELKTRMEKVEIGGKLDGEMGDAYITRSSSREIEPQFVDDQLSLQTNRRSQAQGVSRRLLSVSAKADMTQTNTTPNTPQTGTGNKSPAPPPLTVKNNMAINDSAVVTDISPPPPPPDSEVATADRVKGTAATRKTCEVGPLVAKLQATGDDGNDDYTLNVRNDGGKSQLNINIGTTSVLKATPDKLLLPKGESKQVTISVIDREAAKSGASINISWGEDDCQVNVPRGINIGIVTPPSSYLSFFSTPGVGALVIGGSLTVVLLLGILGVWRCASWRAQTRRGEGDVKYQELEMGIPTAGISNHKDEIPLSADGWDEVWEDDDWQDSEAVRSTSSSLTLSAKGLNSRRANKDGWDSSWDD